MSTQISTKHTLSSLEKLQITKNLNIFRKTNMILFIIISLFLLILLISNTMVYMQKPSDDVDSNKENKNLLITSISMVSFSLFLILMVLIYLYGLHAKFNIT